MKKYILLLFIIHYSLAIFSQKKVYVRMIDTSGWGNNFVDTAGLNADLLTIRGELADTSAELRRVDTVMFTDPCQRPDFYLTYSYTAQFAGPLGPDAGDWQYTAYDTLGNPTDSVQSTLGSVAGFLSSANAQDGFPFVGAWKMIGAACQCEYGNPDLKFFVNGTFVGNTFNEGVHTQSDLGNISGSALDVINVGTINNNGAQHCWVSYRIMEKPPCDP